MKSWLSRQANGDYVLTGLKPIVCEVGRSGKKDVYVRPGDPIGYRHMCPESVRAIWGIELDPLKMVRVDCLGRELGPSLQPEANDLT